MITAEERAQVIKDYGRSEKDSGSTEVQIALLTTRIKNLTGHLQTHKKDHHSRRGLLLLVGQRNKFLKYLARKDQAKYLDLIKRLGLRK